MNILKKLPFYRRYTTGQNAIYWSKRKTGWEEYLETWNHPHRTYITRVLAQLSWISLVEIGCGSGPNLKNIVANLKNKQVGGIDINSEAIEVAKKTFIDGHFRVGNADDVMMTDKSTDVVLSDAFLIYIGPFKIKRYLREMSRIGRNYLVLCEYHSPSLLRRWVARIFSGRHVYDYKKVLTSLGYNDIMIVKMPKFEEDNDQEYRHIILARIPKRVN